MNVKNITQKRKLIMIATVITLCVIAILIGCSIVRRNVEKTIKAGLPNIVNDKINALLEEAAAIESNSDVQKIGLSSVTYEIIDIAKEDGIYILTLEIRCICEDTNASETLQKLVAHDVENCFNTYDDFSIGKYRCRYYYGASNGEYTYKPLVYTYVNDALISMPEKWDTTERENTVKCEACGRRYKNGSDNANSIRMTSMCENCYANFEWTQEVQDAIDNLPAG